MNRQEASKHIGSTVIVDQGQDGVYYGRLEEVQTPPKKMWSGKVTITGLFDVPAVHRSDVILKMKDQSIVVPGGKIDITEEPQTTDFESSAKAALKQVIENLQAASESYASEAETWQEVKASFENEPAEKKQKQSDEQQAPSYVVYRIKKQQDHPFLYEPIHGDELELEGCPFEFEIKINGRWHPASHSRDFTFTDETGASVTLNEGDNVRIHTEQFQPFTILLNELEHPSRRSLLKDLEDFGFSGSDLMDCHNRLLHELLQSEGTTDFKGVNFLMFQTTSSTLVVQHHYERVLKSNAQDYVYDRFEYTADNGVRRISTYTSAYSKDHES
ncbi:DUF2777 family protein [Salibacterium halotolerans]|uniref:DUF2777 family protein n=1 Tax=Salibacterium halotolerans TaxID=1884432 RepID=A0A1I5QBC2_9BACI|nr:DUF2777 family protein [Salibacterium halotolerans]SFP43572.1 Protein of unknown function [Salibacterium halotolerans]